MAECQQTSVALVSITPSNDILVEKHGAKEEKDMTKAKDLDGVKGKSMVFWSKMTKVLKKKHKTWWMRMDLGLRWVLMPNNQGTKGRRFEGKRGKSHLENLWSYQRYFLTIDFKGSQNCGKARITNLIKG